MSTPSTKPGKRTAADADSDPEALGSPPTKKAGSCVICGHTASLNIVKDGNYEAMMQLFWCTMNVDVKPEVCRKNDLCPNCFDKVVNFYETNDIILFFENHFKSQRLELMKNTLKGVQSMEKKGGELSWIHKEFKKKYSDGLDVTEPEEEQMNQTLDRYIMETFVSPEEEGRTVMRLSRTEDPTNADSKETKKVKTISLKSAKNGKKDGDESSDYEGEDSESEESD